MSTKEHERRHRSRHSHSPRPSMFLRIRRDQSISPRQNSREKEGGGFKRLGNKDRSVSARSDSHNQRSYSRYIEALSESEDSEGGHWKSRSKKKKSNKEEDDLSQLWCYMFNSTLTGNARVWFDDLLTESIDSYDDLKKAFLENYLQQKKCIKDPIELHNIKQRDGESTKDFMRMYKLENRDGKGKFKAPPPITTPVEKRNQAKKFEFHGECMHIKKQNEKMLKAGKLSHLIKELKQNNGKKQPKETEKGETSRKDKALAILMVQPWERVARKNITQSFSPNPEIFFPPLGEDERIEGPMIIEAEIGGHCIHRMYVDGGSTSEILYEYCFNRLRPEIKNQLMPATTPLIGFSDEIICPIGQIQLLAKIRDEEHSTADWMNFVVVRSPSPYNGIIERPGVRKLQTVPSTAHRMLKLPVKEGEIALKSRILVSLECIMVSEPKRNLLATN
nr:reverse transcriptase domain-containing protein [Tanacetum cinerariifolium]